MRDGPAASRYEARPTVRGDVPSLETRLTRSLDELNAHYSEALRTIEPLGESMASDERDRRLERMQSIMQSIATLETRSRSMRTEWMATGQHPGATLQQALDRQQELIATLLQRVQSCEQWIGAERSRLIPAVDSEVRHRDMQLAYARHR